MINLLDIIALRYKGSELNALELMEKDPEEYAYQCLTFSCLSSISLLCLAACPLSDASKLEQREAIYKALISISEKTQDNFGSTISDCFTTQEGTKHLLGDVTSSYQSIRLVAL